MKKTIVVIVLVLLLISCSSSQMSEDQAISEIYSDVLVHDLSDSSGDNKDYCPNGDFIISSVTETDFDRGDDWKLASEIFPHLERTTWENYIKANSQPIYFPAGLNIGCEYVLKDITENPSDLSTETCTGVHYFSRIGFNSSRDQALVYHRYHCGSFGYGNLFYLELMDGHWKTIDMTVAWIT